MIIERATRNGLVASGRCAGCIVVFLNYKNINFFNTHKCVRLSADSNKRYTHGKKFFLEAQFKFKPCQKMRCA